MKPYEMPACRSDSGKRAAGNKKFWELGAPYAWGSCQFAGPDPTFLFHPCAHVHFTFTRQVCSSSMGRLFKKGSLSAVDYIIFPIAVALTLYQASHFLPGFSSSSEQGRAPSGSRFLLDDLKRSAASSDGAGAKKQ